jgi:hypothetical protein
MLERPSVELRNALPAFVLNDGTHRIAYRLSPQGPVSEVDRIGQAELRLNLGQPRTGELCNRQFTLLKIYYSSHCCS